MYECENCHESSEKSTYHLPVIDEKNGKKIIVHLECCSRENLIKILKQKIDSEKMFFDDVQNLAENMTKENIKIFEERYGTYDELRSGLQIDRCSEILAIVDQIKKR